MYDECDASTLVVIASMTEEQHQPAPGKAYKPGTCRQCTPDGCAQLTWAQGILAAHRAERAAWRAARPPQ
ncbi:hypothetical protein ACIA5A_06080 [Micromonospora sp. NPDC051300]|uniref:hypothetical protein n=1 Tax=Micromonospora sp. NPDC051300 TaxID=3364286 RepID=UPI00378AA54E